MTLYAPLVLQARAVISSALPSYTASSPSTPNANAPGSNYQPGNISHVLTANANGALAAQDGVTLNVNDTVLLVAGAAGADNGLYTVTSLGSASSPWVLASLFQNFLQAPIYSGAEIAVDGGGTAWGGMPWRLFTAGPLVLGTTSLAFWPRQVTGVQALTGGAATVSNLWVRSTTAGLSLVDQTAAAAVKGVLTAGAGSGSLALTGTSTDSILWSVSNW